MTDLDEIPFDSAARAFVDAAEALRDALEEAERAVDATAAPTQAASDALTALRGSRRGLQRRGCPLRRFA